ncbi:MAG: methyltransferase domain-containing protein [Ignavibacteriaceae bacterium]
MKLIDKLLRAFRANQVIKVIKTAEDFKFVIDLGGYDVYFLKRIIKKITKGAIVDPLAKEYANEKIISIKGDLFDVREKLSLQDNSIDVIFMMAEHLGVQRTRIVDEAFVLLKEGGMVVLTIPDPIVDKILAMLNFIKLIDGMSLEQHDGFDINEMSKYFSEHKFKKVIHKKFQLGLNNLFIF